MTARVLVTWLVLALGQTAVADTANWNAGQDAFRQGDYQSALSHFESARDAGLEGPAVHYNIAVCHFKLGDFAAAGDTFRLISDRFPKMRGLAEYNLGLVARRQGDDVRATGHFLRSYELSTDDETIRVLASRQLRETATAFEPVSVWSGAIGFNAGYDDNVALRDEKGLPVSVTAESPTAELFASIQGPWTGSDGFRFDGSLYVVRNLDADEFDQTEIRAGGFYDWRPGNWRVQTGVHVGAGTLGGDAFDNKIGASVRVSHDLGDNALVNLTLVRDEVNDANSSFAGIAGSRQQLLAHYRWHRAGHWVILRLRQESNKRSDPGVSPDRFGFGAEYRKRQNNGWDYEGGFEFRRSDYDDIAIARTEDLFTLHLGLSRRLRNDWLVLVEFRHSDNDSSDPDYSYDRNQFTIGAIKLF